MSKLTKQEEQIKDLADVLADDDVFSDDDFVFVLDPDGTLKTAMIPDNVGFNAPENVNKILTIFGMTDIDNLGGNATLH